MCCAWSLPDTCISKDWRVVRLPLAGRMAISMRFGVSTRVSMVTCTIEKWVEALFSMGALERRGKLIRMIVHPLWCVIEHGEESRCYCCVVRAGTRCVRQSSWLHHVPGKQSGWQKIGCCHDRERGQQVGKGKIVGALFAIVADV